jgi:DNA-binding LytR/AlgR family response regulator
MKLNCIIIDDEQLARKGIENYVKEIEGLNLLQSFSNPLQAQEFLLNEKVDIMFLDIQMPKISGYSFLRTLSNAPATIITTAYPNYAIEGYELNVMDYLVKPISFERFLKAVNKAKDYVLLQEKVKQGKQEEHYFFIKHENKYEKIIFDELLFTEAMQNYVILHTATRKYISYLTFKSVADFLPQNRFMKVHKSYIVALDKIQQINGLDIKIGTSIISISRSQKDEILNSILQNKLLKR